jgi:hypothetical protein
VCLRRQKDQERGAAGRALRATEQQRRQAARELRAASGGGKQRGGGGERTAATSGTSGCWKSRKALAPRPNQRAAASSADTRPWLPLAADVITATGVVSRTPVTR